MNKRSRAKKWREVKKAAKRKNHVNEERFGSRHEQLKELNKRRGQTKMAAKTDVGFEPSSPSAEAGGNREHETKLQKGEKKNIPLYPGVKLHEMKLGGYFQNVPRGHGGEKNWRVYLRKKKKREKPMEQEG